MARRVAQIGSMDYDQTDIPANYDRGRDHGPELLELWMQAIAAHVRNASIDCILDLGCGTGRFSEALAACFNAAVIGIDPSQKMLARAEQKRTDSRVSYRPGRAEAIPLPDQSVDLIFMSMSFHHFRDAHLATRECRRVLREPGMVFVRTGSRERMAEYPYVPFFPASLPLLHEVLPAIDSVRETFEYAGFKTVAAELIRQTIAPSWAEYAEKLSTGADSVLARLSRQDFEDGLAAVRRHAGAVADQPIVEPIDFMVFR
jgi:ubiquinone/menaquinone biosynthesis C-methylase UbiE